MEIKIALIPSEYMTQAQNLSTQLQKAIEEGEMERVDRFTQELISLTDQKYSLSLKEECWRQFIKNIRDFESDFKSDYIMTQSQLETIMNAHIGELFSEIENIIEQAVKTKSVVLQLPVEEDNVDV